MQVSVALSPWIELMLPSSRIVLSCCCVLEGAKACRCEGRMRGVGRDMVRVLLRFGVWLFGRKGGGCVYPFASWLESDWFVGKRRLLEMWLW